MREESCASWNQNAYILSAGSEKKYIYQHGWLYNSGRLLNSCPTLHA